MSTKKPNKRKKAYIVYTGMMDGGQDGNNWSKYKVQAVDAIDAINTASAFFQDGEYAESVELVLIFD